MYTASVRLIVYYDTMILTNLRRASYYSCSYADRNGDILGYEEDNNKVSMSLVGYRMRYGSSGMCHRGGGHGRGGYFCVSKAEL